ncbi:MAG: hypothetical protein ACOVK6_01610 [Ramlibacter sp.]
MTVVNTSAFNTKFAAAVSAAGTSLKSRLDSINSSAEPMTAEQAMLLNYDMSTYNLLAQTAASIHKEMVDTLKSILSKL